MVRHPVVAMAALLGEQATRIQELTAANATLTAKLAKLEHLQSRNSRNSSMPPSGDDAPGKTPPPVKPKRLVKAVNAASNPVRRGRISSSEGKPTYTRTGFPKARAAAART